MTQFENYTSGLFGRIKRTLKTPFVAVIRHSPIKVGEKIVVIFKDKPTSEQQVYSLDGTRIIGNKISSRTGSSVTDPLIIGNETGKGVIG